MPTVVPVRMHFNTIDLWFDPHQTGAKKGDHVVVSTERGTEFGLVTQDPFEVRANEVKGDLKPVIRVATEQDVERAESLVRRGEETMKLFRRLIKDGGLDMKPVGVEFLFGGEKAVFYFAAEDRVDFRDLIRDLSANLHLRVDMRQIGVRDEARLVGGYAPCGQELCCVRFGGEFEPVSIRMAKEQDLPLNSAKISGVCGRLMCCLRYEFEAYKDFKQRAPKKNAIVDTPLGKAKVVEFNTPRELVTLRLENGKSFTVALKDMTCSEGCRKRCEEQRNPLRPDTVTREALEGLGTPDIIMQLAELDRAAYDAQTPFAADAALARTPSPRRRAPKDPRDGRGAAGQQKEPVAGTGQGRRTARQPAAESGAPAARTPRRRQGGAGPDAAEADALATGQKTARRQHKAAPAQGQVGNGGDEKAEKARQPRGGGMRPRRSPKTPAEQTKATGAPGATEEASQASGRVRRHHRAQTGPEDRPSSAQPQPQATTQERQGRRKPAQKTEQAKAGERRRTGSAERDGSANLAVERLGNGDGSNEGKQPQKRRGPQAHQEPRRKPTAENGGNQASAADASAGAKPDRRPRRRKPGDKGGVADEQ